jgi:hypothetical protein
MNDETQHRTLRGILMAKWLLTLFVWGLPALIAPPALFELLGVPLPDDLIFVRLFGAVVTAAALAYFFAWKDPVQNRAILFYGVLDCALVTVTLIVLALTAGLTSPFLLGSAAVLAFFTVAFIVLMPRPRQA